MAGTKRRAGLAGEQLHLVLAEARSGEPPPRLPGRIVPMVATPGDGPVDDPSYFFEPWWPGTRTFAFVERGRLRLQSEHLADPLASFPELEVIREQVTEDGVILDGTLLVLDDEGRPDAELLRRRLADPSERRGEAAFVASDLLWAAGESLLDRPFGARWDRLGEVLRDGRLCVASRGLRGEGVTLAEAVASMGLTAISARRWDAPYHAGAAGDDWLRLPIVEVPAAETRPLLVLLSRLPLEE
jgi:bifunctional non-homologous end joining protein LigD